MVQIAHLADAHRGRKDYVLPTGPAWSGDMLTAIDGALSPHAFYVHQDPDVTLERHYHDAAEFQVVVAGGGMLGQHAVRPYTVHYAAYQTMYGPLVAQGEGLDYITCRIIYQRGLFYWPQERERMGRGRKAQVSAEAQASAGADLKARVQIAVEDVIAPDEDGLATWLLRLPPGAAGRAPSTPEGAGRFLLLVAGAASLEGEALSHLSIAWIGGKDVAVTAGDGGAEVLVLQLPAESLEDPHRPTTQPAPAR